MTDPVDAEVLAEVLDRHRAASDWKCSCGEELFGGTAAYSWRLYLHHVAAELLALVREAQAAALREAAAAADIFTTVFPGVDVTGRPFPLPGDWLRERADRIEFEAALTEVRTDYREALDRLADDERGNT